MRTRRRGFGATLFSIIFFSVLVVASATLMVGSSYTIDSSTTARVLTRMSLLQQVITGEAALSFLDQAQAYLSRPATCTSLPPGSYLSGLSLSPWSTSGKDNQTGVAYSASASASVFPFIPSSDPRSAPISDNLTTVSRFAGYQPDALDLEMNLSLSEQAGSAASLSRTDEVHILDIPIHFATADSLCSSDLWTLAVAFAGTHCDFTTQAIEFSRALSLMQEQASAQGFVLSAGWSPSGCNVGYWVSLTQPSVQGPMGVFSWSAIGSGSESTGAPSKSPPPTEGVPPYAH